MDKTVYTPHVFNKENIEDAKKIILTQEGDLQTEQRWEEETPFLVDSLIKDLQIKKSDTILDFGCGIGRVAKELIEKTSCKIVGVDISESMRKMALEYVNHENFKVISAIDLQENVKRGFRFDSAYSIWVLQHCLNPNIEIELIKSSLKKDSLFYVLNNNISAVPTNKGWVNNKIDVLALLDFRFEQIKLDKIPLEVSSKKVNENTFIALLKNTKGFTRVSSNEDVIKLLDEALVLYENKKFQEAKDKYLEVLKIEENNESALGNLGIVYKALGDLNLAIDYYVKTIKLNPHNPLTYNNLGNAFKLAKDYKRAILAFSDCIKRDPYNFNAYNNLGIAYESFGDVNKAIASYKEAIRINPKFSKAINNIGVLLYKQKDYEKAIGIFKIALDTDKNYHELNSNIGACYNKLKDHENAIKYLDIAIENDPKNAGAYTNLGNVYNKLHDYKKAAKLHEKSIALAPNGANAYSNVGTSYKYLNYTKKAIDSYKKAIELDPNFVNAHFDLATMYLAKGDFLNGWKHYEWRFKKEEMLPHIVKNKDIFSKPMFTGIEKIAGETLLLHSEQGFGDSIQFIRFLPLIKEKYKCKIALKCRDELKELFKCIKEIDVLVNRSEQTPAFDYHLPIMSMPYILGMKSFKDLPKQKAYLEAKDDEEFKIKKEKGKLNIGICWSASVTGESYDGKVFSLEFFDKLINSENVNVYSLQVGPENEDIKKYNYEEKIIDLTHKLSDFSKTASLMKELDLIISSDTSVAHLAGALNLPVWIPLQKVPDWRWQNKGETIAWYPSAKLFRQKTARVWDSVFKSIYGKLYSKFKIKI